MLEIIGLRVFTTARRPVSMSDLVRMGIHTFELDVCEEESIKKALEWVSGHTGGSLDILVNNALVFFILHYSDRFSSKLIQWARYSSPKSSRFDDLLRIIIACALPALDYKLSHIRQVFEVNVFGVMSLSQSVIPLLLQSTLPGGARIVTIGSVCAMMPAPFEASYNASKAAIHVYGDTLRIELEPFG